MKKNPNQIQTLRKYLTQENSHISSRRFKKVLNNLIKANNAEALVIASTIQFKNMSDDSFQKRRKIFLDRAIKLNFSPAMIELAEEYYQLHDYVNAFELYEKAAELDYAYALKELALAYQLGLYGYPRNQNKAKQLQKRAENGICWSVDKGFDAKYSDYDIGEG